jgi:hypothetical protein
MTMGREESIEGEGLAIEGDGYAIGGGSSN